MGCPLSRATTGCAMSSKRPISNVICRKILWMRGTLRMITAPRNNNNMVRFVDQPIGCRLRLPPSLAGEAQHPPHTSYGASRTLSFSPSHAVACHVAMYERRVTDADERKMAC